MKEMWYGIFSLILALLCFWGGLRFARDAQGRESKSGIEQMEYDVLFP